MQITLESVMGKFGEPNHNGRIYSEDMMRNAIEKWNHEGRKYGTLNPNYDGTNFLCPPIGEISHEVKEVHIEDGELKGTVEILNTERGKMAEELVKQKFNLSLSPRMLAELKPVMDEEGNPVKDENGNDVKEVVNVAIISFDLL